MRARSPLLLLALAACSSEPTPSTPPSTTTGPLDGRTIEVVDAAGLEQWLAARRGTPLLVDLWATWCQPCCDEMPDLVAATRAFRQQGGTVAGIALECVVPDVTAAQAEAKVRAAIARLGIDFPVLICTEGDFGVVGAVFGIEMGALPQTLAIDRRGTLVERHEGTASREEFESLCAAAAK